MSMYKRLSSHRPDSQGLRPARIENGLSTDEFVLLACKVDQQRELRLAPGRLIAAIDMLSENISA